MNIFFDFLSVCSYRLLDKETKTVWPCLIMFCFFIEIPEDIFPARWKINMSIYNCWECHILQKTYKGDFSDYSKRSYWWSMKQNKNYHSLLCLLPLQRNLDLPSATLDLFSLWLDSGSSLTPLLWGLNTQPYTGQISATKLLKARSLTLGKAPWKILRASD